MKGNITLLAFDTCPNTPEARKTLDRMGIEYEFKIITEEEAKDIPEFYGSPSFLFNGKNLEEGSHSWSCRLVDWDSLEKIMSNLIESNDISRKNKD